MKWLGVILCLGFSLYCRADDLVSRAKITVLGNTPDGSQSFFVRTSGGFGPCVDGVVIVFPLSLSPDEGAHNRAFSLALTAYTAGKSVKIATLSNGDTNCRRAAYIDLSE